MIAKPDWFDRRKYTGWGLTPKTWQGWLYTLLAVGVFCLIQDINLNATLKMIVTGIWMIFILVDFLHTMISIKMDEREQKIEAIAERNASWTMVASTVLVLLYVTTLGNELKGTTLTPILLSPVITGLIAKASTNFILERRGI